MNFKQIDAFLWAARLGSFSAAARRLNTTQPAISLRIGELERSLGVSLFSRGQRALRLTPEGREFSDYAKGISDLAIAAQTRLGGACLAGRFKLGVTESVALTWLADLVTRLNDAFPAMSIDLDVDLTSNVWRKLRGGDLDLAILPGPAYGADLVATWLGSILYTWMASPRLEIGTGHRPVGPADLLSVPIITLSGESNLHGIIAGWFAQKSTVLRRIDTCNSLGVIAELTMAGLGVSLLPPTIFADRIRDSRLYRLDVAPAIAPLEFWAVQPRRGRTALTDAVARLASEVSTFDFAHPPNGRGSRVSRR